MNKKKKIIGIILFLALNAAAIGITAYIESKKNDGRLITPGADFNIWFIVAAFGCFALAMLSETLKYYILIKRFCGVRSLALAFRIAILGKYYDYITPSGIGGQPFQIYYLNKAGASVSSSASAVVAGFISMQLSFGIYAVVAFIFFGHSIEVTGIRIAAYIGLFFYMIFPVALILFAAFPRFSSGTLHFIAKLLSALHIIKNREEKETLWKQTVDEYSVNIKAFFSHRKILIPVMLQALIYQGAVASVAYFVIHAFGGSIGFLTSIAVFMFVQSSVSFIPTPGNAGAAESSFYIIFGILSESNIFLAMLLWRFFTCYGFVLTGMPISLAEMLRKRKEDKIEDGKQ